MKGRVLIFYSADLNSSSGVFPLCLQQEELCYGKGDEAHHKEHQRQIKQGRQIQVSISLGKFICQGHGYGSGCIEQGCGDPVVVSQDKGDSHGLAKRPAK